MSILRPVADDQNSAEATGEQYEKGIVELREGSYRFSSKVRGQTELNM